MSHEIRDQRLRRLLRDADPAGPGLTRDEIHEMRRTVLSAVPERRRRLLPFFATAGAVLVAALILIAVLILRPGSEKPPVPPRIAAVPPKAVVQPPPFREEPRLPEEKTEEKPTPVRGNRKAPIHPIPTEPEETVLLASAEPRQIQFSTPGGTRIVWVLSPEDVALQGE